MLNSKRHVSMMRFDCRRQAASAGPGVAHSLFDTPITAGANTQRLIEEIPVCRRARKFANNGVSQIHRFTIQFHGRLDRRPTEKLRDQIVSCVDQLAIFLRYRR